MTFFSWSAKENPCIVRQGHPFVKMHGLRNDFIIVDARHMPFNPTVQQIQNMCDRREGIGGDELLIVEQASIIDKENDIRARVRIINPDGREVEACGNASRCIGWLLMKESDSKTVLFRTLGGILGCTLTGHKSVCVSMGKLRTLWQEIPLSQSMDTLHLEIGEGPLQDPVAMNIGNPHAVFFVEDIDRIDLARYGARLQQHPLFPEQANIGVAEMVDPATMKLEVWERPGAMTTACGSGACAAVGAARRRGLTDQRNICVIMPAGSVEIEINKDNEALMTGPVETCFTGFLPYFEDK